MRMLGLVVLALLLAAPAVAQTPRSVSVTNATVEKVWTLTGYSVSIPDAANPQSGNIEIRFSFMTKVDGATLVTEQRSATVSGAAAMLALLSDISTRVATAFAAKDPNAYYSGTRAALYAWLQANGHIEAEAQ